MRTVSVNKNKPTAASQTSTSNASPPSTLSYHFLRSIRPTQKSETQTLRAFSNSRLESISECPTFGVVHIQRQYPQHGRALALEAGEAMHQFFAAMRVWQLAEKQKLPAHSKAAGTRIFGPGRYAGLRQAMAEG